MLISYAHPIAESLPPLFKGLMQAGQLVGREKSRQPIFPTRQNPIGFAKIDRATVRQLIINLLENWPDLLVLVRSKFHFAAPTLRRIAKPSRRVALTTHLVFGRAHYQKCAGQRPGNKTCQHEKSDLPSTWRVHA